MVNLTRNGTNNRKGQSTGPSYDPVFRFGARAARRSSLALKGTNMQRTVQHLYIQLVGVGPCFCFCFSFVVFRFSFLFLFLRKAQSAKRMEHGAWSQGAPNSKLSALSNTCANQIVVRMFGKVVQTSEPCNLTQKYRSC